MDNDMTRVFAEINQKADKALSTAVADLCNKHGGAAVAKALVQHVTHTFQLKAAEAEKALGDYQGVKNVLTKMETK